MFRFREKALDDEALEFAMQIAEIPLMYAEASWKNVNKNLKNYIFESFFNGLDRHNEEYLPKSFFIYGGAGTGKSSLAALIAKYYISITYCYVKFIYACDLFDVFFTKDTLLQHNIKTASILIIDDLGRSYDTELPLQKFFQLIEFRYSNKMPTIFTSNLDWNELASKYGYDAIADRISDSKWCLPIALNGDSKRK